jgi:YbgC/YbaW family acyl-CoA thioester hydrolase
MLVLAGIEASFQAPARLDDLLCVSAELSELSGARVVFEQSVHRQSPEGELLCRGVAHVACVDVERGRPRRLPASLLDGLS